VPLERHIDAAVFAVRREQQIQPGRQNTGRMTAETVNQLDHGAVSSRHGGV